MTRAASPLTHSPLRRLTAGIAALAIAIVGVGLVTGVGAESARAAGPALLSQGKTATATSGDAALAFDGNAGSRWESAHGVDPQSIQVDLGVVSDLTEVQLDWEAANAKDYTLEVSDNGTDWDVVATRTDMAGGNRSDVITLTDVEGRYVRVVGTARNLIYGYSIFEFRVYGTIAVSSPATPTGKTVEVVGSYGDWDLYVNGSPYTVKGITWGPVTSGAGAISAEKLDEYLDDLVSLGVNTIRTWGTDAGSQVLFDAAAAHGIKVIAGFWIQPGGGPGSGGCPNFVSGTDAYLDQVRTDVATFVAQYKNHPAVLMWSLGNESLLGLGNCYTEGALESQRNAYAAFVNELALAVKAIDVNHPVTSTDAWVGAWPYLKANAPALDLYAINAYGALAGVQDAWAAGGYTVPYIVTETGPQGEWEAPLDGTGKPFEASDTVKAQAYTDAWAEISSNQGVALGATLFHFGTETDFGGVWFNIFPGEKKRAAWYAIAQAYGGPAASGNKPPVISAVGAPTASVVGGSSFTITATVTDPESDPTDVTIRQSGNYATGSNALTAATATGGSGSWTVTAPTDAGVWKFYVTATDDHGNIAYAPVSVVVTDASGVNVALGKTATAKSSQDPAANAVDGNAATKWGSALDGNWNGQDDEWFQVDLGARYRVNQVKLLWEGAAYGKDYDILVSTDGTNWTTVAEKRDQTQGTHAVPFSETEARYVKLQGIHRGSTFGYSFYEFQVFSPDGLSLDAQTVCGRDLVNAGGVTATASRGNAADAINNNVWARWDSGATEEPPGSGNWVGRDGEWIQLDLGASHSVCGIKTYWEAAYARDYDVLVSLDGSSWTTAAQVRGVAGAGPEVSRFDPVTARYLKIVSVTRGTQFGISLWDLEVFEARSIDVPTTELLGDHVLVFDPSMDALDIQALMDSVFADQEEDQFGEGRWQFFFLPGEYDVDARVGFYTSLAGAGLDPTEVEIHGADWVDAEWFDMNATQNFWRSAENLTYVPDGGVGRWAVSQAAPLRRVNVEGDLLLDSGRYGWSSGGFLADSKVSGWVKSWTQQQWYSRDSEVGTWGGGVWNFVYSGVEGDVAKGDAGADAAIRATLPNSYAAWPTPPITALATTGAVAEKPFLYLSGSDVESAADWSVFVPGLREGTTGATWTDGTDASDGASLSLEDFFIVKEGATATQVNAALAAGKNILFTPGVYRMDQTLQVTNPDTVILGLGLATIIPTGDSFGMHIADVDGVRIAGLLFDAAVTESPALLVVGDKDAHTDHSANPIVLNDVYMRVGGPVAGKVKAAMIVNADDTIIDHLWSWRGDHGEGIGWDQNTSDYGLVVNGDNVSAYGLFVEHYQKYNVLWKGQGGRTIFYQNELPYDVPNQEAWNHDGVRGWAAYKVDEGVTTHEAWGLGSYSNFTSDTEEDEITVDNGFEVPKGEPGVKLHHLLTVSLGGEGIFEHVINGVGARQFDTASIPSYVAEYPVPGDPDAGTDPAAAPADPATNPETDPAAHPVTVRLSAGSVVQGGTVHVEASGLPAGATAEVWIYSTPQLLATTTVDGLGRLSLTVRVPAGIPAGSHTIVVTVPAASVSGTAALQVTAARLSATGADPGGATAVAVALLLAGAAALGLRRRKRAIAA
ncbi:discoidin domain-containing protein [Protaetiibacter larvae]|uniref:beta-mannosidase n=1 Tax=Protaetiibacter larvae TaxID=2592654 RepID=A0A5C1Y4C5_9MICO|nr:discoidin domain-containing protein [Protaetiibacter larvae]QEO08570.1 hypothetical protein FLP23_00110 [Protaetiibacter larvae]